MNNACPRCGALYNVSSKDIGRRIACKKCRAPLTVGDEGIRVEEESLAAGEEGDTLDEDGGEESFSEVPRRRQARQRSTVKLPAWLTVSTVPTVLFGVGIFFVVVFTFFPEIDRASALRAKAAITQGDLEDQKDELLTQQLNDGNPDADTLAARRKRNEAWADQKRILEIEHKLAEADAERALVWNQRGLLFGFLMLSFAGIGYLITDQPPSRKLLGGILLVLIFLAVTGGGVMLRVGGS